MNIVNVQFERDGLIRHQVGQIIIRTKPYSPSASLWDSSNSPYAPEDEADTVVYLNAIKNHWNLYHTDIDRDLMQVRLFVIGLSVSTFGRV